MSVLLLGLPFAGLLLLRPFLARLCPPCRGRWGTPVGSSVLVSWLRRERMYPYGEPGSGFVSTEGRGASSSAFAAPGERRDSRRAGGGI
ncbi:MAG: hypothetical protein AVDCRST_MAG37-3586 [uncultured Rubrobacteraceae bacterium]|uniref:Uncharacterized protein n=1 Tax=uncultured Rubrobacteraceae bacterium TaxID=349277 RepID=A0A6J4RA11_9ACTN|nr:MAG: hypothetical protein AVDCRST_MAG37-3586 [uncultured Rubrobacteraceae bacterium]